MLQLLALLFCLVVVGCKSVPPPTEQQLAAADIGRPPTQAEAEASAKEFLGTMLKDPMSAVTRYTPIDRGAYHSLPEQPWSFGWVLLAIVNAKNSYGGYTGEREWSFYFRGGTSIVAVAIPETDSHGYAFTRIVELSAPRPAPRP